MAVSTKRTAASPDKGASRNVFATTCGGRRGRTCSARGPQARRVQHFADEVEHARLPADAATRVPRLQAVAHVPLCLAQARHEVDVLPQELCDHNEARRLTMHTAARSALLHRLLCSERRDGPHNTGRQRTCFLLAFPAAAPLLVAPVPVFESFVTHRYLSANSGLTDNVSPGAATADTTCSRSRSTENTGTAVIYTRSGVLTCAMLPSEAVRFCFLAAMLAPLSACNGCLLTSLR